MTPARPAAVLDVDGTLVDSNYHHALAWYRAFREPVMGGDGYVAAVAGDEIEERPGNALRAGWQERSTSCCPRSSPATAPRT